MEKLIKNIFAVLSSKRFKSFYWQSLWYVVAGFVALVSDSLNLLELSPQVTVFVAFALAQVSKAVANKREGKEAGFINEN